MHLPSPCWIISDAHLGVAPADAERDLLALLAAAPTHARSLVVNGDLFEFWFEWRHVIPRTGFRTVAALATARASGLPIVFIGGNHDCWGGDALIRDTGVEYVLGPWEGTLGHRLARIEHGDGLRATEDKRYRALRRVLRHPLARAAYRLVHPDAGIALARATSHTSRNTRARDGGAGLRTVALDLLQSRPELDLVVFGHSHVAGLARAASGGVFANPGAWLNGPTFLTVDDDAVSLRRWNGSAEGHGLDTLDFRTEKPLSEPEKLRGSV